MPTNPMSRIRMNALHAAPPVPVDWLWHGLLVGGGVTLLTSRWKTGKTTLLTGLFRHLGTGRPFLGLGVRPGRAWVVSEESADLWRDRTLDDPLGGHVELMSRPFRGRPTFDDWRTLIGAAADARRAGELDLFAIDPLASFLPGRCESSAEVLLEALQPLHDLAGAGVAVLLLHHPRKKAAEAGSSARGSGALLGFVDVNAELTRYSKLKSDAHRRLLVAESRRPETPPRVSYEWDPATGEFRLVADVRERQFEENWPVLLSVLDDRTAGATAKELREAWPPDAEKPSLGTLYDWLNQAFAKKRVRREGKGTNVRPWRYRLPNADDAYSDLGELPPLPPLL